MRYLSVCQKLNLTTQFFTIIFIQNCMFDAVLTDNLVTRGGGVHTPIIDSWAKSENPMKHYTSSWAVKEANSWNLFIQQWRSRFNTSLPALPASFQSLFQY